MTYDIYHEHEAQLLRTRFHHRPLDSITNLRLLHLHTRWNHARKIAKMKKIVPNNTYDGVSSAIHSELPNYHHAAVVRARSRQHHQDRHAQYFWLRDSSPSPIAFRNRPLNKQKQSDKSLGVINPQGHTRAHASSPLRPRGYPSLIRF